MVEATAEYQPSVSWKACSRNLKITESNCLKPPDLGQAFKTDCQKPLLHEVPSFVVVMIVMVVMTTK